MQWEAREAHDAGCTDWWEPGFPPAAAFGAADAILVISVPATAACATDEALCATGACAGCLRAMDDADELSEGGVGFVFDGATQMSFCTGEEDVIADTGEVACEPLVSDGLLPPRGCEKTKYAHRLKPLEKYNEAGHHHLLSWTQIIYMQHAGLSWDGDESLQ